MLVIVAMALLLVRVGVAATLGIPDPSNLPFQCFKDFAHIFMGYLLCLCGQSYWQPTLKFWKWAPTNYWRLFWLMNLIEVLCAVLPRLNP